MRCGTLMLMLAAPALAALPTGAGSAASKSSAPEATSAAEPVHAKSSKKDPSKRVCRSRLPTGTRMSIRECRTQAEWDEQAIKTQDELQRQMLNNSNRQQPSGSGQPPFNP